MSNVRKEEELYEPMCKWLKTYLQDKYRRYNCDIIIDDSHAVTLDKVLTNHGLIDYYPHVIGLNIQIDILGIVDFGDGKSELYFIEAKKTKLNLHNLGQLWAYCKLCNPSGAWLLSSDGLGSLSDVLINQHREDLLDFGDGKTIKKMIVGKWDVDRNSVNNNSLVPKL